LSFYRIKRTFRKGDTIRTESQAKSELRKVKGKTRNTTGKLQNTVKDKASKAKGNTKDTTKEGREKF
jgi:hypothetical protein